MYGYQFDSSNLAVRVDTASPTLQYVGYTQGNGTNTSGAIWYIKKIETIGTEQIILRAGGAGKFDQVRNDRASLTNYS